MPATQEGIMSLPADPTMTPPPGSGGASEGPSIGQSGLSRADAFSATKEALAETNPQLSAEMQAMLNDISDELLNVPEEQLQMILGLIQHMQEHEKDYKSLRKNLIEQGILDEGDFPEEYDPEFLAVVEMVIENALNTGVDAPIEMTPPPGFARGGIAEAARQVAQHGRNGDSILAHINPQEALMLRRYGGAGRINPETGLPEFGFFSKIVSGLKSAVKSVANAVKKVVQSPVGKVLGTVALTALAGWAMPALSSAATAAIGQGAATILGGGDLKDAVKSAALGYFGGSNSPLNKYTSGLASSLGITSNVATSALNQGLMGTAVDVLSGKSLKDSIKSGLTSAAMGAAGTYMTEGYRPGVDMQQAVVDAPPSTGSSDAYGTEGFVGSGGAKDTLANIPPGGSGGLRSLIPDFNVDSVTGLLKNEKGEYSPWKVGAAGAGLLALTGGFKPKPVGGSQFQDEIVKGPDVPRNLLWGVQNMRGVKYNPDGTFADVQERWNPYDYPAPTGPTAQPAVMPPTFSPVMPGQSNVDFASLFNPARAAQGGIASLSNGGYPRRMGHISGPGTSTSDSIPAMLSDGEFVMTARAVNGAGNGNREEGAKRMYQLMHQLERNA